MPPLLVNSGYDVAAMAQQERSYALAPYPFVHLSTTDQALADDVRQVL